MNEPQLFKAGDPRVTVNGLPLQGDGRFVPEAMYQELIKPIGIISTLEEKKSSGINIPPWVIIVSAIIFIIIFHFIYNYFNHGEVKQLETDKAAVENKIDSTHTVQDQKRSELTTKAQDRADQSNNITKQFQNEKITIPDAAYSDMCDYVAGYRAE